MRETTVWLVRHPETVWNNEGRYQGRCDAPLTPLGARQAAALAAQLAEAGVEAVYSSPLGRAMSVAVPTAQRAGVELSVDERLTEIAHGPWEGRRRQEIAHEDLYHHWKTAPHHVRFPGGETLAEVQTRAVEAIGPLFGRVQNVAVVTHHAVIRVLLLAALRRPLAHFHELPVPNASVTVLTGRSLEGCAVHGPEVGHLDADCTIPEGMAL